MEGKMKNVLQFIGMCKDFLCRTSMTQILRAATHKWDLMKLKSFCMVKDNII